MNSPDLNFVEAVRTHDPERLELPADLTVWVDEHALAFWAKATVEMSVALRCGAPVTEYFEPQQRERELVRLLIFCYATGRFDSSGIVHELSQRGILFGHFGVEVEDWFELMRLRRRQRDWLKSCLAMLLQKVWEARSEVVALWSFAPLAVEVESPTPVPPPSSNWFLQEAEGRIRLAAQRDSMALDD